MFMPSELGGKDTRWACPSFSSLFLARFAIYTFTPRNTIFNAPLVLSRHGRRPSSSTLAYLLHLLKVEARALQVVRPVRGENIELI